MNQLYSIMRDFLEVEYHQKSFLHLLNSLQIEQEQSELLISCATYYLEALQQELHTAIHKLDLYIVQQKKQK